MTLYRGSLVPALAEVFATLVEAALLAWWWGARPLTSVLAAAFVANGLSLVVGREVLAGLTF